MRSYDLAAKDAPGGRISSTLLGRARRRDISVDMSSCKNRCGAHRQRSLHRSSRRTYVLQYRRRNRKDSAIREHVRFFAVVGTKLFRGCGQAQARNKQGQNSEDEALSHLSMIE